MADSEQIIRLSGEEDIHAVRTMLARAQAQRLLLVIPSRHPAFQRIVRLKMVARQAYDEGVQVAIVSNDYGIRDLATQIGLSNFRSVEAARRARRWSEPDATEYPDLARNGQNSPTLEWKRGRGAVLERQKLIGTRSNWGESVMLAGLVFGMMIVLSAVLLLLVPSAQITLIPQQVPLQQTNVVRVDTTAQAIEVGNQVLPGEQIRKVVEDTIEAPTTGHRDVPSSKASGTVLFVNITGQAVNILTDTIVTTSSGSPVRFRTMEDVSVPGELNARVEVPIEAITPGPQGNVGPLQINRIEGAAAAAVSVLNETGTSGGNVEQRAVVTAADQEQLRKQLQQRLIQAGRAAIEQELEAQADRSVEEGPDRFLLPGELDFEVIAETFSGNVDDQLDTLKLQMRAEVTGVVVSRSDLERLATRLLQPDVPANYQMLEDGFEVTPGEAERVSRDVWEIVAESEAVAGAELSADEIRGLVRGQPVNEAHAVLLQRLPLAADPSLAVYPEWWNRMPYLPLRIFIRVGVLGSDEDQQEGLSEGEE